MATNEQIIGFARRVFGDPKSVIDQVNSAADELGGSYLPLEGFPVGGELPALSVSSQAPSPERLPEYLRAGARAMEKVAKDATPILTPDEQFGLEAIVVLFGRPALLIQDGDFALPPPQWQSKLDANRDTIREAINRVGRIELKGHPTYPWIGTGFLVGANVIMTNRHVAVAFASEKNGTYSFLPGVTASIDYKEEYQRDESNEFELLEVIGIHTDYDLALLRVQTKGANQQGAPDPLRVASKAPSAVKDFDVVTIGYPAYDSRNDPTEMIRIFDNIFNVKRLQPGTLTGLSAQANVEVIGHDCSTLGGNSGSAVVDFDSGQVLGLHFGGRYLAGNYAVPLWKLTNDPLLRSAKIRWA